MSDDRRSCLACGDDCGTNRVFRSVVTARGVELVGPFCSMTCRDVHYARLQPDAPSSNTGRN